MSTVKGLRAGVMASILAGAALAAGVAQAQGFSTERPGSILIFPKVVNDNVDTIIQITNTSNSMTYAHCFYVERRHGQRPAALAGHGLRARAHPSAADALGGERGPRGQSDRHCTTGLDPGLVPPVVPGFTGS